MRFQFSLRAILLLFVYVAGVLTWFELLGPSRHVRDWLPGWQGWLALFGMWCGGVIGFVAPRLSADIFLLSWLLVCYEFADGCYCAMYFYHNSNGTLPSTDETVEHVLMVFRCCLTLPLILLPFACRTLGSATLGRCYTAMLLLATICDIGALLVIVRYVFVC